jgi:hypothetical protein
LELPLWGGVTCGKNLIFPNCNAAEKHPALTSQPFNSCRMNPVKMRLLSTYPIARLTSAGAHFTLFKPQ